MTDEEMDAGEMWRAIKKNRQEKRASNRDNSADLLRASGVIFEERNIGAHLIVTGPGNELIDFWPGTGRWIPRTTKRRGFGVRNLLTYLQGSTL
jgi:hypothetical protein